jgi:uncharacterized protein (TIGR03435 family)
MKGSIAGALLISCAVSLTLAQSRDAPAKFDAADVHVSAKSANPNQFLRTGPLHAGRYEVKSATMVDLIRIAYGFDSDKIVGGPSWLEMDRFDVIAKAPVESTPEALKLMLQALLEERFQLVLHKDTRPLFVLTAGMKHQLKPSDGSGQTACKLQTGTGAPAGERRRVIGNVNGSMIELGPDMTIRYACRNMTMAAFATGLRGMIGEPAIPNAVLDETALKGAWDFDLKYPLRESGPALANSADRIPIADAIDKQLGLTLEEKPIPTPVIEVDQVNRTPSANPPGVVELLPSIPAPTEFEVASVKPADVSVRTSRYQMQPGGRLIAEGMSLRFLIGRAFNTANDDQVVGAPKFADTDRYDVVAQAPSAGLSVAPLDDEVVAPMLRALLAARFRMTYHWEDRPVNAYSLVSVKPKMKKADPASRTFCRGYFDVGAPQGSRVLTCRNIAMAQFVTMLHDNSPELRWPLQDATGIEGGWDFTMTFGWPAARAPGAGDVPSAADPAGRYTFVEAVEKQLGLKLEKQKRQMPVIVIDHIEQKPTDN